MLLNPYRFGVASIPSVLLTHLNGSNGSTTFTDVYGHTITANGNAQVSTAQSKFGGASAIFDGTGDYLSLANNNDWRFPADFTVEAFVYLTSNPKSYAGTYGAMIAGTWNGSGGTLGWQLRLDGNSSSYTGFQFYTGSTTITASHAISLNTWYHICVSRTSGTLKLFIDGVEKTSVSNTNSVFSSGTTALTIGSLTDATYKFELIGHIDELRITKGYGRYTGAFTPTTTEFTE